MTESELGEIGEEIFNFVKENFPNALSWPIKSRYFMTKLENDLVTISYERFKSDNSWRPSRNIYIKEKDLGNYNGDNVFVDSTCKHLPIKKYKKE